LSNVAKQLQEKGVKLDATEEAKDFLGEKGYDPTYGARPLRRVIQNLVEDQLSEALLKGGFHSGDTIVLEKEGDNITFRVVILAPTASAQSQD